MFNQNQQNVAAGSDLSQLLLEVPLSALEPLADVAAAVTMIGSQLTAATARYPIRASRRVL